MAIARILEVERRTTQSGNARAGRWQLEFERSEAQRPDPLTGWNGSGDTKTQVRLGFKTKEAAIEYCHRHGLQLDRLGQGRHRQWLQQLGRSWRWHERHRE